MPASTRSLTPPATAVDTAQAVRSGKTTAEASMRDTILRIGAQEDRIHAWQVFDADRALREAQAFDARGANGLLAGVPLAVKDIFDTADMPTRYGSSIYDGFRPASDAACVAVARAAGAVVAGKTVTTEFAYFQPGPTANPHDIAHTPGGSSSGSAAAVAAGMVPLAFGSQTAGSLIRPASYCGVFALKPTHGLFRLDGVKALAPSLDTLGWLARTADDLELLRCALDNAEFRPLQAAPAAALRIGVCRTHEWRAIGPDGAAAFATAAAHASSAGMHLSDVEIPLPLDGLMQAQKVVIAYEAARSLAPEWELHRDHLSAALSTLIRSGQQTTDTAYAAAQSLATLGRAWADACLNDVDVLLVPSAPGAAPAGLAATGDPIFNRVWTLLGLPCTNVPGLQGHNGLPIGVQLVGRMRGERPLLEASAAMHRALNAHRLNS